MEPSAEITVHDIKLLSIGYYIHGGILGLYSLLMFAYLAFIGAIFGLSGGQAGSPLQNTPPAGVLFAIGAVFVAVLLVVLAYTVATFLAGYWLTKRTHKTFILVIAALTCLGVPYGTVLGICTFIVLNRDQSRALFATQAGTFSSAPAGPETPFFSPPA